MTIEQLREAVRANFDAIHPARDGSKLNEHFVAHYSRDELIQTLVSADYREIDDHLTEESRYEESKG